MTMAIQAPNGERREYPARLSALRATAAFAQEFCAQHRVTQRVVLRLTLMVEELFTNIVTHGHGGDSDATIVVGLSVTANRLRLSLADAAPRFDPRPSFLTPPESLSAPSSARPAGGLGLHLVGTMAFRVRYAYRSGNRLVLAIPIEEGDLDA